MTKPVSVLINDRYEYAVEDFEILGGTVTVVTVPHEDIVVEFDIPEEIAPEEFAGAVRELNLNSRMGILLSGKMPVWGWGIVVHIVHVTTYIAILDPCLGGCVVVMVRPDEKQVKVGQVLRIPGLSLG
ncbi:MAG: CRISPR-associated ring nuclease Crn3/Csx3 [Candidatus Kaiserbacteria bacterium]|nr:CRISPR-associated ring nuclease Crn3/Csx3 [Candidatus Kaiserbacteria bacterium]